MTKLELTVCNKIWHCWCSEPTTPPVQAVACPNTTGCGFRIFRSHDLTFPLVGDADISLVLFFHDLQVIDAVFFARPSGAVLSWVRGMCRILELGSI